MRRGLSAYRRLLKLYPARFREEYGTPLERQFADEYRDAQGTFGRAAFWVRLSLDLVVSIPRELARELRQDLRYSLRIHARRPAVTLLALVALTFAIGATTGVFSVVNALLLRSLPFRAPERIVRIDAYRPFNTDTPAAFEQWRTHSPWLEDAAIYDSAEMNVSRASGSTRLRVTETSFNFFTVLGDEPPVGRGFSRGEDVAGGNMVAVISDVTWRDMFGADPRALGATIRVNGTPLTVIGIAPRGFDYPARTAIWAPTVFEWERLPKADMTVFLTFGRVKPGLSFAHAQRMLDAEVARGMAGKPRLDVAALRRAGLVEPRATLVPIRDELAGPVQRASLVLMAAVVFVLLVACANVANLLLTRVADRRQELMIRAALGASRARLAQQLITESVVLTLVAASAGLVVARWASGLATAVQPAQVSAQDYLILDWRVLGFAVCLAVVTGLVFGVFPALVMARLQPAPDLGRTRPGADGSRAGRLRGVLIAVQVCLTLILVAGAVATSRSFVGLLRKDLGFRTDHVVTVMVSLAGSRYDTDVAKRAYYREAVERLKAIPGVERAAAVNCLPLATTGFSGGGFTVEGGPMTFAAVIAVTPDYFRTLGVGMAEGREFDARDTAGSERVVVVNDVFARRARDGGQLAGRTLTMRGGKRGWKIVGVSSAVRDGAAAAGKGSPQVFMPIEQYTPPSVAFAMRVRGNPEAYLVVARDTLRGLDRQVSVYDVRTLDDRLANTLARPRFYTTVVIFFGGLALLLALMGVYGVVCHAVAQRTHEVGVRLALGSSPSAARWLFVRGGLLPIALGTLVGLAGAAATGRVLQHLVVQAERPEIATSVLVALGLNATAGLAMWRATRRVVHLQPMDVLRSE